MTVKLSRRSLLQGVSLAAQQLGVSTATATRQMTTLRTLLHDPLSFADTTASFRPRA